MGWKGPPAPSITNKKGGVREMDINFCLPPEAFTNEASNFWLGALVGAGLLFVVSQIYLSDSRVQSDR
jgi:hypothetical protein